MRKLILLMLLPVLLTGCTKIVIVGSLRPTLPVPKRPVLVLPDGLVTKKLIEKEVEEMVEALHSTTNHIERLEAIIVRYNLRSKEVNETIRKSLGIKVE